MRLSRTVLDRGDFVVKKPQNEKGFTLIEVLMGISIFAVGLLAIATMQISAIKVNSSANYLTERTTYAQDKLEELMSLGYTDANLSAGPHTDNSIPNYTITWVVNDNNPVTDSKYITITSSARGKSTVLISVKSKM